MMSNQTNHADHTNPMTQIDHLFDEKGAFTPKCYINRDLSALRFQLRVLAQAANPNHPLLERMFFLTIFSSNLDEFLRFVLQAYCKK